ncbi:hypothetical protein JTE90_026998 [Oedothorax gibbosus]|uniref:Mab-21-like HhH/H2TH-like domain-containing protein n=1 Tax=Oedothorax gibbosus TaxID=931172 RepID=A0AAV6VBB2_9ARAC|nr:hypothetical protein JTE90_026998 [Oedothorax gibbosus]
MQILIFIKVKELENLPYVTFQVDKNSLNELKDDKLKSLFDGNYLILKKVHSWFQSNVAKFCSYCEKTSKFKDLGILKVEKSESGPACTLKLCTSSHVTKGNVGTSQFEHISVDLVPVFLIDVDHLTRYTYSNIHDLSEVDGQYCHMVPKPLKKELNFLTPSTASKAWRVSFPVQEKHTFADKEPLKIVMKLMKMLRDHENWKMPSYFCKAAAFWLVNKHPLSSYWSDSDLGDLFLECLDDFHKHLTLNHLGHIIYPNFNLLHTLTPNTIEQIRKRIQNIQGKLQRNPAYAYSLFKSYQLL